MYKKKDGTMTLKLADFGLAMEVKEPIYTVCGTPTYVAPEILSEIGEYNYIVCGSPIYIVYVMPTYIAQEILSEIGELSVTHRRVQTKGLIA